MGVVAGKISPAVNSSVEDMEAEGGEERVDIGDNHPSAWPGNSAGFDDRFIEVDEVRQRQGAHAQIDSAARQR